jgi:hypothetical protein
MSRRNQNLLIVVTALAISVYFTLSRLGVVPPPPR